MLSLGVQAQEVIKNSTVEPRVEFDSDVLKRRGIDKKLAEYFAAVPRYSRGQHRVTLFVNDVRLREVNVFFDSDGLLRFDKNLLDAAGLVIPEQTLGAAERLNAEEEGAQAYDFLAAYPDTVIDLRPAKTEVHLIVPPDAVRPLQRSSRHFLSGGQAALLNYRALGTQSEFSGGHSSYHSLDTEAGLNAGDWIVRSRQSYTAQNGKRALSHLYAYGQKTFPAEQMMVQGGQINVANNMVSGDAITGVQLLPEAGLRSAAEDNDVVVEGVAHSTARIEVRQNHAVIHTTVVPAGAFRLTGLQLLNGNDDLQVTIIEADNSRRGFVIPAASFAGAVVGLLPGYSLAAGQYRHYGEAGGRQPVLVTGSGTWRLARSTSFTAGLLSATGYQVAGWAVDQALTSHTSFGVRQQLSSASDQGVHGTQISASLSSRVSQSVSASFSATRRSDGYRYLGDTTSTRGGRERWRSVVRNREQYTASLGWVDREWGAFRVAHSYSARFDNRSTQRLMGSWSQSYKYANVALTLEKTLGTAQPFDRGTSVNFTVSLPFGGRSVGGFVSSDRTRTRSGVSLSERVSDEFGYRLQAERDSADRQADLSVMTQVMPHYTQASFGYSRYGASSTSYSARLEGGVVAHGEGLTFSPYPVSDTFSLLKVGELSGVKVATPRGPVWTDFAGRAVAPGLAPYANNRLTLEAKTLPRNADVTNTYKELEVGRGSVSRVNFEVSSTRRLLITVKGVDGKPLAKGLSVLNEAGRYVTTSVGNGQVFILDAVSDARLSVALSDRNSCLLDYVLPPISDRTVYFESVEAVCKNF